MPEVWAEGDCVVEPADGQEVEMKTYILYWKTGKTEKVFGTDIADAMTHAGYGAGAVPALDYYAEVKDKTTRNRQLKNA